MFGVARGLHVRGKKEMSIELYHGDCLELMKSIPDGSVDMVLCDLPYGTTELKWDIVIPFEPLWEQYRRVIKNNGAILLFSVQPFTTDLINSNRKMFRYEIIWSKTQPLGFLNAKKMPLRAHENILVFYKNLPTYNPIKHKVECKDIGHVHGGKNGKLYEQYIGRKRGNSEYKINGLGVYGGINPNVAKTYEYIETGERYPTDIVKFSNWNGALFGNTTKANKHPTQKPVPLLEYLIKTYTNEGETVLDNTMGSGSTGVACINTGRNFIGIELDDNYFEIAKTRIEQYKTQGSLF